MNAAGYFLMDCVDGCGRLAPQGQQRCADCDELDALYEQRRAAMARRAALARRTEPRGPYLVQDAGVVAVGELPADGIAEAVCAGDGFAGWRRRDVAEFLVMAVGVVVTLCGVTMGAWYAGRALIGLLLRLSAPQ